MSSRHIKVLFSILGIVTVVGGIFFSLRASGEEDVSFRNNEASFAEVPSPASSTPLSVIAATSSPMKIPILVYHIVRPAYPTDSRAVRALAQTPEVFDAQMQYLAEAGYHVIPFRLFEDHLLKNAPLPSNPIVLTFDDGWSDQFTYAFPILEKYHYTATFFIFTNPIGHHGFLTWEDLQKLLAAGMTIGSHTLSHPFLTKITNPAILWNEIDGSKQILEKKLGITVREFAYPFGQYNATTTALLKQAGYVVARGDYVMRGNVQSADNLYALSALNAPTSLELFKRTFPAH